jgi:NADPH:quinone reductase-like Zn-dependent oxidoreductase
VHSALSGKKPNYPAACGGDLHYLGDKSGIGNGDKVLIYAVSGGVGTYAVQLAKSFEAEVTGVCSATNIELVKLIGADRVIDYTKEDFMQGSECYDLIFDTIGKVSQSKSKKVLNSNGRFVSVKQGTDVGHREKSLFLKVQIEAGKLKAVIDRCYIFEQIPDAHRCVETFRKKGNVVVRVVNLTDKS